jgi:hypothetical protein
LRFVAYIVIPWPRTDRVQIDAPATIAIKIKAKITISLGFMV